MSARYEAAAGTVRPGGSREEGASNMSCESEAQPRQSGERTCYLGRKAPATSAALALVIITAGTKVTGGTGWPER